MGENHAKQLVKESRSICLPLQLQGSNSNENTVYKAKSLVAVCMEVPIMDSRQLGFFPLVVTSLLHIKFEATGIQVCSITECVDKAIYTHQIDFLYLQYPRP